MKRLLLLSMIVATTCIFTGCQDPRTTGVNVDNLNTGSDDNPLIRVWVLDEEQIQSPPATRAEAEQVGNLVTYPFNIYQFQREPGTYFVVASNETHFQSLAADESFDAGEDFNLFQVEVTDGFLEVSVVNTDTPTFLPVITADGN
ncbi:MAG: hypothetical protein AAFN77_20525 [Planctomycetota bacterium]